MKPEIIDFPLEGKDPRNYSWLIKGILTVAVAGALVGLGAYLDKPAEKLPANSYCQAALDAASEGLKISNDQIRAALKGEDAPTPDISAVKTAAIACKDNKGIYTVTEASK